MEQFKNHIALLGKNAGCIGKLRGKVLLVIFLVDDAKNKWDDAAEKQYKQVVRSACLRLMKASGLPLSRLNITYATQRASVPYEVTRRSCLKMTRDVLQTCYCNDPESFQETYKQEMGKDEVCVSFVLNRTFISYAQRMISCGTVLRTPNGKGNEFSVVSFRKGSMKHSEHSLVHELLHQFGVMDYYAYPVAKKAAASYLPGSIMNDGEEIDDLSRYVIGWTDTLTPNAIAFLKATASMTLQDIY